MATSPLARPRARKSLTSSVTVTLSLIGRVPAAQAFSRTRSTFSALRRLSVPVDSRLGTPFMWYLMYQLLEPGTLNTLPVPLGRLAIPSLLFCTPCFCPSFRSEEHTSELQSLRH